MKQERRSQSRSKKEEEVDRSTSTTIGSVTVTDIASSSGRGDKSDKQHMPVKDGVQVPVPRSCCCVMISRIKNQGSSDPLKT
jgi:hypothetical protein